MDESEKPAGWVVMVRTERLGGGKPMTVGYAAIFPKLEDAVSAVKKHVQFADGDSIGATGPLKERTVKALGLKLGDVRML